LDVAVDLRKGSPTLIAIVNAIRIQKMIK